MSDTMTMVEAINLALRSEMQRDDTVVILGEDVGVNGGVFRATVGLREAFGIKRVLDTPLAETMIAGLSVGMAAQGLKPIAEIQFMGFIFPTMEHLICHAARLRHRTRGRLHCPMVLRVPFGGGIHAPEHHSESTEALFAHIPGLRVVIPSSPARAYGLLLAAIRNPDPVLFMEPKRIYRLNAQPVEDNGKALPLDSCYTLREGNDITLISWGAMIKETLEAADQLAKQGVSCEVIDVVTLNPIDHETMLASVAKTGRCVIIHEAPKSCAVGAEISATLAERGLLSLQAPITRVTGYDTVMPYYRMENHYLPNTADIIDAVNSTLEFS
ncbi:alpha-ketoacid dehydrogenase subunit beta [Amphritea sp. 2_MG-2023]|uniref:alpha-ketoacid dehydrogenase subunit beta n=1 Tax=Amphritea TaxID=515417 RepID=UPI001C079C60|nr:MULTISPECIES: alpha-ketoacid dehydrogenase subunit beta [Amphritea]MBU2967516.1 alpha-ketoacid dehydrogenase subunit beta [Amphritea atlantica]MDO6420522.1 alpha-ketoacid dehydrogenase subunit beta [Amphritea sp. 2_MG-2023]